MVGIGLHHLPALRQVGREVVGRADSIALHVRQLQFNVRMVEAVLVQDRRGHAAETVPSHSAGVPHAL